MDWQWLRHGALLSPLPRHWATSGHEDPSCRPNLPRPTGHDHAKDATMPSSITAPQDLPFDVATPEPCTNTTDNQTSPPVAHSDDCIPSNTVSAQ